MSFHTRRACPARGQSTWNNNLRRTVVYLDVALFDRLIGEAQYRRLPLAAIVREKLTAQMDVETITQSKTMNVLG